MADAQPTVLGRCHPEKRGRLRVALRAATRVVALALMASTGTALAQPYFFMTLGAGSFARGVNDAGQVAGYILSGGNARATLWNGTTITDLNSFLSAADVSAGWELRNATAISDNGSIVGSAYNTLTGQGEAFLLTPVPEPGTYAMLLAGLAMVGAAARRSRIRPRGPQDADPRAAVADATRSGSRPR